VQPALTIIAAFVAVMASSVGVIVAVDQLTLRARLRRTAEVAHELTKHEENQERLVVLRSVHDVAVARLAAGWVVPWWRFGETAYWLAGVTFGIGTVVAIEGWTTNAAIIVSLLFVMSTTGVRRGVRTYLERQRITQEYLSGVKVAPPRLSIVDLMKGGARIEWIVALAVSLGLAVAAVGIGLLIRNPSEGVFALLLLWGAGVLIASFPARWLWSRAVRPLD